MDAIKDFCQTNGLPWDSQKHAQLQSYLEMLLHFNKAMNLIGPLSRDEVIRELLIDSLVAAVASPPGGHIMDVGSGAGLPGIPLKILYPHCPLTIVEPRQKRTTFLKIVRTRLSLIDLNIERKRIEELSPGRYDYVISKAFQPPLQWLQTASEWLSPQGMVVCLTRAYEKEGLLAKAQQLDLSLHNAVDNVQELIGQNVENAEEIRSVFAFRSI